MRRLKTADNDSFLSLHFSSVHKFSEKTTNQQYKSILFMKKDTIYLYKTHQWTCAG